MGKLARSKPVLNRLFSFTSSHTAVMSYYVYPAKEQCIDQTVQLWAAMAGYLGDPSQVNSTEEERSCDKNKYAVLFEKALRDVVAECAKQVSQVELSYRNRACTLLEKACRAAKVSAVFPELTSSYINFSLGYVAFAAGKGLPYVYYQLAHTGKWHALSSAANYDSVTNVLRSSSERRVCRQRLSKKRA